MGRWTYRVTVITLCTLAFFATMVARLVISPVVPEIEAAFGVSSAITGIALTGMWMAYSLSQFPSGLLADRYGERLVILVAVGLTAVASGALALSPSIWLFVVLTIVLGAVAGLHYSVATTLLTKEFDDIGTAIGIHNSGAPLAGLLAPLAAAAVAGWVGWRYSIALGAVTAAPIFLLFAWKVRGTEPARPNQPMRERIALGPVLELLTRPQIAFTALLAICFEFVWQATASFLPAFLVAHHGYSIGLASAMFSAYFVVHGLTQPAVGSLSDRFGRDRVAAGCALLGIAGYGLLVGGSGLPTLGVAILLVGIAMSWGAAVLPRFMDHLSAEERGAGFGLVRTSYMLVSATGSAVVGTVADLASWGVAFSVFLALLSVVVCALGANRALDLGL
ncbi:regulatory protein UhpC [Halalkalicoccus paucihalophilus]|uniref:Regulatory protein UhpC n=1 Tax=Halalkalicoccus paucihalophilus TaxID=1008153 RepID=A0A151AJV1_9EURY|nr:MFS transporter [Halalkalicoccus paucihalophilus]KYH27911.1 regulatory protein UhpC [Halalkalicoccus paucihalophilus]